MPVLFRDFLAIRNLRDTVLATDATHIHIEAPFDRPDQYINRKERYFVVFLLTVDSKYIIRDLFGGHPGSSHDAFVYAASSFKNYVDQEILFPYVAIGDAAYPASDHLLIPLKAL